MYLASPRGLPAPGHQLGISPRPRDGGLPHRLTFSAGRDRRWWSSLCSKAIGPRHHQKNPSDATLWEEIEMNGTLGSGYSRGHSLALVATASLAGSVLGIAPISFVRSVAAPPSRPASLQAGLVSKIAAYPGLLHVQRGWAGDDGPRRKRDRLCNLIPIAEQPELSYRSRLHACGLLRIVSVKMIWSSGLTIAA